jgi:hypothetical protein
MTETGIAKQLDVGRSAISRDIKVLKELSQKFVYSPEVKKVVDFADALILTDFIQLLERIVIILSNN